MNAENKDNPTLDWRQINKAVVRQFRARRGNRKGFCPCCCLGTPPEERRYVKRARRREGKMLSRAYLEMYRGG